MSYVVVFYLIVAPLILIASIVGTLVYRRNRLKQAVDEPPFDYQRTDEITIDPTTGIKQRIWYNRATGERYYQNITDPSTKRK